MRRLLRDKVSKAYLGEDGTWTVHYSLAKDFSNTGVLVKKAQAFPEMQLEIVLILQDAPSEYDLVLPLRAPDSRASGSLDEHPLRQRKRPPA